MTRIRKRPSTVNSSVSPELHASSNGGHKHILSAGAKSNPSFQDPRQSLFCPSSWVNKDRLQLPAGASNCSHGESSPVEGAKQQLAAHATSEALYYRTVPTYTVNSPCGPRLRSNEEHLGRTGARLRVGERANREYMDDPQHGDKLGKYMHTDEEVDDGGYNIGRTCLGKKVTKEAAKSWVSNYAAGRRELERSAGATAAGRNERDQRAILIKHGSSQVIMEELINRREPDPTDVADDGAAEYPRKVLPLQLILKSDARTSAGAPTCSTNYAVDIQVGAHVRKPAHSVMVQMGPVKSMRQQIKQQQHSAGSSTSTSAATPSLLDNYKGGEGGPAAERPEQLETSPLHQKAGQPLPFTSFKTESELPDVKSIQAARGADNQEEAANSSSDDDQSLEWPVSSWQGHRRARSFGGRNIITSGTPGQRLAGRPTTRNIVHTSDVNENKAKGDPNTEKKKKPLLQVKKLMPVTIPQEISLSTAGDAGSKKRKHAVANAALDKTRVDFLANSADNSAADQAASDHPIIHPDSMRCRRKDGRRWRCKEQVVKPGAPFCAYHTLKMKEKHVASVARRLRKKLQNIEGDGDLNRIIRAASRSCRRQKLLKSSSWISKNEGYNIGRGAQGAAAAASGHKAEEDGDDDDEEDQPEEEEELELEESSSDGSIDENIQRVMISNARQPKAVAAGGIDKQQQEVAASSSRVLSKSRWRKKCKPCIRRLHDIQDRARPAAQQQQQLVIAADVADSLSDEQPPVAAAEDDHNIIEATSSINSLLWAVVSPAHLHIITSACANTTTYVSASSSFRPPLITTSHALPDCQLNTDPYEWRPDFL